MGQSNRQRSLKFMKEEYYNVNIVCNMIEQCVAFKTNVFSIGTNYKGRKISIVHDFSRLLSFEDRLRRTKARLFARSEESAGNGYLQHNCYRFIGRGGGEGFGYSPFRDKRDNCVLTPRRVSRAD